MSDCSCGDACSIGGFGDGGAFMSRGDDWQARIFQHAAFDLAERSRRIVHMMTIDASVAVPAGRVIVPARFRDTQRAALIR